MIVRVLLIDNHDSFTYNLYQQLARLTGQPPLVCENDSVSTAEIRAIDPDAVVLSPGPGRSNRRADFGVCEDIFSDLDLPVLGVCLGHQGLGHYRGAFLRRADRVMHGKTSRLRHVGRDLFAGMAADLAVVRYHSWVVDGELPDCLEALAWSQSGELMAMRDRSRPLWGVQFHPESICTEGGDALIKNFLRLAAVQRSATGMSPVPVPFTSGTSPAKRPTATRSSQARSGARLRVHTREIDFYRDPEACFCRLYAASERAFWLDSSLPGVSATAPARYTYMGDASGPAAMTLRYRSPGELQIESRDGVERRAERLLTYLRSAPTIEDSGALPFPFRGGFVGVLGYELKAECTDRGHSAPATADDDAHLIFADRFLCFDVVDRRLWAVALSTGDADPAEAYLDDVSAALRSVERPPEPAVMPEAAPVSSYLRRNRRQYLADIAACKELIRDGESYELCLTNQVVTRAVPSPLELFRVLRRENPSPYGAFLRFGELAVVSSSPEQFLCIDASGNVTSRPIKGTAERRSSGSDRAQIARLRNSEKDRAENLMIVDLVRNDLGRVCAAGTVEVPELMAIESFATVHQMVSTIRGRLASGKNAIDCLEACFPGGSMTGAPKRRTMELLERIEGARRGLYSGAIGFVGLDGALHLSIAIRTAVCRPDETTIGIGGAIVDQSDPQDELDESLLKARALVDAIRLVCGDRAAPELSVRSQAEGEYA